MTTSSLPRALLFTGIVTWIGIWLSSVLPSKPDWRLYLWAIASTLFVTSFVWNARAAKSSLLAIAGQSAGVIAMVGLLCNGYEGLLLVLIAAQLALYGDKRLGLAWISVQSVALGIVVGVHWSAQAALLLTPPYLGFQLLMFAAVWLLVEERRARDRLTEANKTLTRLESELARKARVEERLKIAQDLHDVLGHRLTALSLNLEVASHESVDSAHGTIRIAQALARELLRDVTSLARSASDDKPVDLPAELSQLARELPRPRLHIGYPEDLQIADASTSRALFRVVQEIVTNAIRHGKAQNLWLTIERTPTRVILLARDDGAAGVSIVEGFGLMGMRRRIEELGGTLSAARNPSGGFEVRAEVPYGRPEAA